MRVLVTGASGQLGQAVVTEATARGMEVVGCEHSAMPIENESAVEKVMGSVRPDLVVHCAAWTDVNGCERDPERALIINGVGTAHVAGCCRELNAALVYVSTDYVFAGDARSPYRENDAVGPLSAYGRSKLAGERAVADAGLDRAYTVRTSWVFGPGGHNFPRAILDRAKDAEQLRVVNDQIGSPTFTRDLAPALLDLPSLEAPSGVYHATNEGHCTWHTFAVELCRRAGFDAHVEEMETVTREGVAPRPAWSVLDCSLLSVVRGKRLPNWPHAIDRYLAEEQV